ncbi:type 1 glutamine amidotransferase [Flavobacterium zepuense]|uniref:Type 1 glutamine amidotransferase n=1 Tax=Flavobacterium zepuense TaxID=2593302 RepID=A0A552UXD6_9FLAO|nr:type 1 glutamine amidotransferase [Flavobacterium zepuense]TRW22820.1 type 1 glutamine amidotransferase [Flavobacterium zepuense]
MKSLRIHYLQHVSFEGPGCISEWALSNNHELTNTRLYNDEAFPAIDAIDWLIIMGGPMSANDGDTINWINSEKEFISSAIQAGKTVIGVCLGSQLIASVLGAEVYQNKHREIGWFPIYGPDNEINLLFDETVPKEVFHWHGETFSLPEGTQLLAFSEACKNQAYLYGDRVLGLQFHLEVTKESLAQMITFGKEELDGAKYTQPADFILAQENLIAGNNALMYRILNHFASKQ